MLEVSAAEPAARRDAFELDAERGDPRVFSQNWERRIPRDLV